MSPHVQAFARVGTPLETKHTKIAFPGGPSFHVRGLTPEEVDSVVREAANLLQRDDYEKIQIGRAHV